MKRYLYVDESGTEGRLFVVALVFAGADQTEAEKSLLDLEALTGKGVAKWHKSKHDRRARYLHGLVRAKLLGLRAYYSVARDTRDFVGATLDAVARAIQAEAKSGDEVRVRMDALRRTERHPFRGKLRDRLPPGVWLQVRGIRDEGSDPFARLVDALAGALRAAEEGKPFGVDFRDQGIAAGWLRALP